LVETTIPTVIVISATISAVDATHSQQKPPSFP